MFPLIIHIILVMINFHFSALPHLQGSALADEGTMVTFHDCYLGFGGKASACHQTGIGAEHRNLGLQRTVAASQ